jgi:hypothetical protein
VARVRAEMDAISLGVAGENPETNRFVLVLTAFGVAVVPARRATRIDPVSALSRESVCLGTELLLKPCRLGNKTPHSPPLRTYKVLVTCLTRSIMKRTLLLLVGVLSVPMAVEAQSAAQTIERALAAAPARSAADATVIRWNTDYTYETLQEGSNTWVCYDRSDEARRAAFDVQCTSLTNLDRVAQNRRFRVESADRESENAMIAAAEANGTRVAPEFGSPFISARGQDQASAGRHMTIAVPGATSASTGLPDNGRAGGAFIMGAGTGAAHIMTPGS